MDYNFLIIIIKKNGDAKGGENFPSFLRIRTIPLVRSFDSPSFICWGHFRLNWGGFSPDKSCPQPHHDLISAAIAAS